MLHTAVGFKQPVGRFVEEEGCFYSLTDLVETGNTKGFEMLQTFLKEKALPLWSSLPTQDIHKV